MNNDAILALYDKLNDINRMPSNKLYWYSCKYGMPEEGALILIYVDGDEQVFPAKSITNTGECYTFGSLVRLHENDFYAYMPNPPENR